jgi:prepilin-type processing-associated H-X9-DG protein
VNEPNQPYCRGPNGPYNWGYADSINWGHGNSSNSQEIRGLFNRFGAQFIFPGSAPDGTSITILMGEALIGGHDHLMGNQWWGFNNGNAHGTTIIPINSMLPEKFTGTCPLRLDNWNIGWGFNSRHPGGANFAFADGSVHFLSQSIDHMTYNRLGCRNDGQPVGDY